MVRQYRYIDFQDRKEISTRYETTFINGGLRLKPLKTNNGVTFIRSLYLSPLEDVIDMVQFYERTTPQGGSYIVAKAGFLTAAVIMPYEHDGNYGLD